MIKRDQAQQNMHQVTSTRTSSGSSVSSVDRSWGIVTFFVTCGQFALLPIQVDDASLVAYRLRVLLAYYLAVVRNRLLGGGRKERWR